MQVSKKGIIRLVSLVVYSVWSPIFFWGSPLVLKKGGFGAFLAIFTPVLVLLLVPSQVQKLGQMRPVFVKVQFFLLGFRVTPGQHEKWHVLSPFFLDFLDFLDFLEFFFPQDFLEF